jgi:hypothetical protein
MTLPIEIARPMTIAPNLGTSTGDAGGPHPHSGSDER